MTRFFFSGKELKDDYQIGQIYKYNKLNSDDAFVISVMLLSANFYNNNLQVRNGNGKIKNK
jgi:hypothetical protein